DRARVCGMVWSAGFLDERKELQILPADLFEVAINLSGIFNIDVVDDAEQVDMHLRPTEHLERLDDLFMCRLLTFGHPVVVVQFTRTIEAEADIEILFAEKFAP